MPTNSPLNLLRAMPRAPQPSPDAREAWDAEAALRQQNDPLWKKVGRNAIDAVSGFLGEGADADSSPGLKAGALAATLPLAGLISIYKTKAAREAATAAFKQRINQIPNPHIAQAGQELAARYPRVAAHIDPKVVPADYMPGGTAAVKLVPGRVNKPIELAIPPLGLDDAKTYEDAQNILYHEATHAAQALGNSQAAPLYRASMQTKGYLDNPFEINARQTAERKMRDPSLPPPTPVHKQLAEIAKPPDNPLLQLVRSWSGNQPTPEGYNPKRMIQMILDHRAKKGTP